MLIIFVILQTLDKACKYYSEQKIPFPKISLSDEDKKNLKECYVFQDSDSPRCPIVIFLPLVNDTFQEYKAPGKIQGQRIKQKAALPTSLTLEAPTLLLPRPPALYLSPLLTAVRIHLLYFLVSREVEFKILLLLNLGDMKNANAGMGPGGKLLKTRIRMLFCK